VARLPRHLQQPRTLRVGLLETADPRQRDVPCTQRFHQPLARRGSQEQGHGPVAALDCLVVAHEAVGNHRAHGQCHSPEGIAADGLADGFGLLQHRDTVVVPGRRDPPAGWQTDALARGAPVPHLACYQRPRTTGVGAGEAVLRLLEESERPAIIRFGNEADLTRILQHPTTSIACDCGAATNAVHPRYFGTYPCVLGRYVREQNALTWEDAVRKMTSLPAATIGSRIAG
jgi:hypothetical protein